MKNTITQSLLNEVVNYGGFPMTRRDVFLHCKKNGVRMGLYGADYFAFKTKKIDAAPITLAEFEKIEASLNRNREAA